ncbi:Hypothetical protein R9X50_00631500 [Acrodontium crateriforme]|uniref:J domain-containing protein n=1 Tax=Acrodontium crateriforme TaxID=150365 RepID=A0AAQ3RC36_9PEZI|nr:Hypothetical protein R9X50_00631500 [Acrodontium crateriforme]
MSSEYNYDSDAQFFPFFVLTVTSLITLPLTYTLLRKPADATGANRASHIETTYQPDNADLIDIQRAKQKRKELRLKRMLFALGGWLVMAYMVYLMVVTARTAPTIWNPYDILDIAFTATEKQINSRYRRLSITMHPDKRTPNAALNETLESVNDDWVEIVKAYKALTDEEVRNNYIMYGNPDGKQSTSFGIALPHFLIAEGSGKYVLVVYGLLLGIGLPWLVGKWWYGMQKMTRDRVLVTSAGNMFKEYRERMEPGDIAAAITTAEEFEEILRGAKADSGLGKLEQKLQTNAAEFMSAKDKKTLSEIEDPVRRKALALTWAYLTRTLLDDKTLEAEKFELAPTAFQLNDAFQAFCLAYGFTSPLQSCYYLSQCLTQAIPPNDRLPLLQLPHFTPSIVRSIEKTAAAEQRQHLSIQSFMDLPAEQRRSLAQVAGLSNDRLKVAEGVARQLPYLKIEKTFFKVQGEKYIIPSSLVQFVVKARIIPPGTTNVPKVSEKDLLDTDPVEGDIDAMKKEQEVHHVPLVYAPYFARDRTPRWSVFLVDARMGKIAVPPFTFQGFEKPTFDADGKPTFEVVTLKMQFQAPPQAGSYKFQAHLICDSYVGFDQKVDAIMTIDDASKAQEVDSDDDISEPEEDSIAGQMAALKGEAAGANKPRQPRKKQIQQPVESDYDSNTDEDEDDDDSETDTDTSDEE